MKVYEKSSLINCAIEDLFEFHLDLRNLVKITPKDTSVKLVGELFTPVKGSIITLDTLKNCIPMRWEVEVSEVNRPNLLVDVAVKSPFKFWKHSHIFTQLAEGKIELRDRVEFVLPFGFIGKLFEGIVVKQLEKMFLYRHNETRKILEERR
ncbi:MAG: SRPBCC family protein [Campylobacterales bacterium]|nr:SRPBCC family protein [Campylobacterales bacterium]